MNKHVEYNIKQSILAVGKDNSGENSRGNKNNENEVVEINDEDDMPGRSSLFTEKILWGKIFQMMKQSLQVPVIGMMKGKVKVGNRSKANQNKNRKKQMKQWLVSSNRNKFGNTNLKMSKVQTEKIKPGVIVSVFMEQKVQVMESSKLTEKEIWKFRHSWKH